MFIELIDTLRCVRPHEDSWLVGSFDELVDRHIIRGTLGCPVCGAEYPVRGGVADFRMARETLPDRAAAPLDAPDEAGALRLAAPDEAGALRLEAPDEAGALRLEAPDEAEAMRLAALLGLDEPGGVVLLLGEWAPFAPLLEELVPGLQFVLVNPASPVFPFASSVRSAAVLPVAGAAIRAVAYDAAAAPGMSAGEAARVIRPGGRLLAPVSESLPDGVIELARDGRQWVGVRQGSAGPVVRLTRRR